MTSRSSPLRWVRHLAEAGFFLTGFLLIPWLPRRVVLCLARGVGRTAFRCCGRSRRVALANLATVLAADCSESERVHIARESFVTAARLVIDVFWFGVRTRRRVSRWVRFDESLTHLFNTNPAIAVTGHIGNWEVMSQALAMAGYPYVGIAAPLRNPFVNAILNHIRQKGPQRIASKQGAVREVIQELRQGGRTIVLLDQNIVPRDGGVFVDFFGLPVPVSKIAPALAQRTGARVVFIYCVPDADGGYVAHARSPLDIEDGEDEQATTQRILSVCEDVIRATPGQWQWMYKRWRYIPPGRNREGYPFYAEPIPEPFLKKSTVEAS